jgi:hypothetical protein
MGETMFELDHLFVCTAEGAPEADRLAALGLTEGSRNVHAGQGTANRRFFFRNAMLELLWVAVPAEAQSQAVRATRLWERWSGRGGAACPFGFCLRPRERGAEGPPFPSWEYRPPYLPGDSAILVATSAGVLSEPMLFHIAFGARPDAAPAAIRQPLEHRAGFREITSIRWIRPDDAPPSPELEAVIRTGAVSVGSGREHLVEVAFDGGARGRVADLRPHLPLTFHW